MALRDVMHGAGTLPRAFGWLLRHGRAMRLALLPMGLALFVAAGLSVLWVVRIDDIAEAISSATAVRVGITILGALLTVFVFALAYLAANALLAGPFYELLAERVLAMEHGIQAPPRTRAWVLEQVVSVAREVAKLAVFLFLQAVILPLWLLPVIGSILYAALAFAVGVVYLAVDSCDYPMCAMRMAIPEKVRWLRGHRDGALGLGAAATLWAVIPVVNLILPPVAVTAGALLYGEDPAAGTVIRER